MTSMMMLVMDKIYSPLSTTRNSYTGPLYFQADLPCVPHQSIETYHVLHGDTKCCKVTPHAQTAVFCRRNINMQVDKMILTSLASCDS